MTKYFSRIGFCLCSLTMILSFSTPTAFSQTEKFGIVKYTPPAGWDKTQNENVIAFSSVNKATGEFCIITVHGAIASDGSPQNDFVNEWDKLVVQPLKAQANPKTQTESADGWTVTRGGATVEIQGGKSLALLTVFSGFGKAVSVLGVLNEPSYLPQLQAFISGITLDKTTLAAPPATSQTVPVQSGPPGQTSPGRFGAMGYAAPAGWSEQRFQDGVVFKPLDLPEGEHLAVQIMQPLNASGTLGTSPGAKLR